MCLAKKIMTILNVAEKNDAAKHIANFLSAGRAVRKEGASKFNKLYEFPYNFRGNQSNMIMTSVSGHLMNFEFPSNCKNWNDLNPVELFAKPVHKVCADNYQPIKKSLEQLIRQCNMLIIWTDCDREGENIGMEIVNVCRAVNSVITIKRAKFSQITNSSVTIAINNLIDMDEKASQAVDVRQELDLRIGASFTRLQTLYLRKTFPTLLNTQVISYGSCQFPTLGFVVERYKAIEDFKPEPFWKIVLTHTKNENEVIFNWDRVRLFDENIVLTLLQNITDNGSTACVFDISTKSKSKWRPVAMDTIEMEKIASRKLGINAKMTMQIAEKLYSQGYISYPRTETNIFPKDINLVPLVEAQLGDDRWRAFASRLINEGINPHNGKKSDQAHPPIHPLKVGRELQGNEAKVYELITRHFLACLSKDAQGNETKVSVECVSGVHGTRIWPLVNGQIRSSGLGELFNITGLVILARNYLDVYPYDKWSDKELPLYEKGEIFQPNFVGIEQGVTSPPQLLTEADLIQLMDKHGIGTDATHAEHISKVKERNYIGNTGPGDKFLVPGKLGMGLVEGYDLMGFYLSRPNLRAKLEADLVDICRGSKQPQIVLATHILEYKTIFQDAVININKLSDGVSKFLNESPTTNASDFVSTLQSQTSTINVRACPICDGFVAVKKLPNAGWMLGCSNYPICNHSVWLPSNVELATVAKDRSTGSPIVCNNQHDNAKNHPVHKISLKFNSRMNMIADILPDDEQMYTFCVYCHEDACATLGIRQSRERSAQAIPTPSRRQQASTGTGNTPAGDSLPHVVPSRAVVAPSFTSPMPPSNITASVQSPLNSDSENVPLCFCGQRSSQRTVVKEGPNKGRPFFSCATQTCNSFFWGDNNTSGAPTTTMNSYASNVQANQSGDPGVNCDCQMPAKIIKVQKESANKGREFYGCAARKCNFFQWTNEPSRNAPQTTSKKRPHIDKIDTGNKRTFTAPEDMWPPMANDFKISTKPKAPRRCSRCKGLGHTVKTCPQN